MAEMELSERLLRAASSRLPSSVTHRRSRPAPPANQSLLWKSFCFKENKCTATALLSARAAQPGSPLMKMVIPPRGRRSAGDEIGCCNFLSAMEHVTRLFMSATDLRELNTISWERPGAKDVESLDVPRRNVMKEK